MAQASRGMLITLEGIDGSGKSTLARALADQLQSHGHTVVLTKEPGGSELGKKLREILQTQPVPITPQAEFLLFAADRAQHFKEVVMPALRARHIVISDRMADSSLVYQGYGRGLDLEMIKAVNAWVMSGIKPDLTFYVRISTHDAALRLKARGKLTAFEQEQEQFTARLVDGFDTLFKDNPSARILDACLDKQTVALNAFMAVEQWLLNN